MSDVPVSDLADLANSYKNVLSADKNAQYDQIIDIDLNKVSASCMCVLGLR